jgi:hypothetical protein
MKNPNHPFLWGRLLPAAAFLLATGCSSTSGGDTEPAPSPEPAAQVMPAAPEATLPPASSPTVAEDVKAGKFDNGRMWTFEYAPLEYFSQEYGFNPDEEWFEKARLGALRIQGCSASFVSPNGLVMTNHHCARGSVTEVSGEGENLLDNGFYATRLDSERTSSQTADQLIEIIDVTDRVMTATASATTDAALTQAIEASQDSIAENISVERGGEEAGYLVQVIALWNGAKYSAYVFRRYTDVRLVLAPELQIGFFGGDPDNFTYPRYNLDMSFYRIYDENGAPLQSDVYFTWSEEGVEEGDAVFVIGNPGGSSRLQTVSQLDYRRVVGDKTILGFIDTRLEALRAYYDADPEGAEEADTRNLIFSLENSQKAYRGMVEGLYNSEYMARRADSERQFREAVNADPALSAEYGDLFDQMTETQEQMTALGPEFGAYFAIGSPNWTSATMLRALAAYQYLGQGAQAARDQLLAIGNKNPTLEKGLLEARLRDLEDYLGADDAVVSQILQGRTPEAAAEDLLAHSVLADSARAADAIESGVLTMEDPAVQVIAAIIQPVVQMQTAMSQLNTQEEAISAKLGRARFDVYGTTIPPDATFSLRIADGVVTGYKYNGTLAPIYTTFYGLYDRYYSHGGPGTPWDLPARWLSPPAEFDLATPLNFVMTSDVIGGNSGSPVINKDLEVVGLIFDGNIESLPGDYIYDTSVNRSVAVDVRGILEALDDIYDADRIVLELTTGQMVETEEAADAARR